MKPLRLTVLTPDETLLDVAGVTWVQVQLADGGGIGIWPGHAPLLAETVAAPLRYCVEAGGEHSVELAAGILWVAADGVTLLAGGAAGEKAFPAGAEARFGRLAHALLAQIAD